MPIRAQCKGCGQKLSATEKYAGKTIKCPKCGSPVRIPGLELVEVEEPYEDSGEAADEDGFDDFGDLDGDYGTDLEDDYDFGDESDDGSYSADISEPPPRKKEASQEKKKKKKKKSSSAGIGSFLQTVLQMIVAFRLFLAAGVALILVVGVLVSSGIIGGREEQLFVGEYGSPRTTSEWIAHLYEYEKDQIEGVHILQKRKDRYLRVTKNIENCIGPDPAALPAVFAALRDKSPPNYRGYRLAETVLGKFVSTRTVPLYGDVKAALQDEDSEVVSWGLELAPLVGSSQARLRPIVEELSRSADADHAAAATACLALLSAE